MTGNMSYLLNYKETDGEYGAFGGNHKVGKIIRKANKSVKLMMEKLFGMELELMLTQKPRKPKRKDTQVPQPSGPTDIVTDEAVHKELGDRLVRAATTTSSLETEQDSDSLKLKELMELCTNLQKKVLDLEKTKTTQQHEITSLKRKVKKLEQKKSSRTHGLKRLHKVGMSRRVESSSDEEYLGKDASKQGRRINAIDVDEDITLVNVQDDAEMFDVNTLTGDEDKGKGIMVEELVKTMKKKDLIRLDEETAKRLQVEFDEDERLAREKDEANVALIEEWDDI
ncbi:hypothetical protein Tco_0764702 [Tanacetum coccineum]